MSSSAASRSPQQSLANLSSIATIEFNAAARYAAYALQADQEGYLRVASLLRAVSRSEQIHASNHTATLIKMGGGWTPALEPFQINGTIENLKAAIRDELHEINEIFPVFLREAEAQALFDAERSLTYAIASEISHVQLLMSAIDQLEEPGLSMQQFLSQPMLSYVCPVCGFISEDGGGADCPVCGQCGNQFDCVV